MTPESIKFAVTAFHAYAHKLSCQVKYHPLYLDGFGQTGTLYTSQYIGFFENINATLDLFFEIDGEGCERIWSFLNGFISMTRSMSKGNRELVLAEAVDYFKNQKMTNIRML